jgi:PAS domain S-box-containing protein
MCKRGLFMNIHSLKFRLPFILVIFVLIIFGIIVLLFQTIIINYMKDDALHKNMVISEMVSDQISLYLEDAKSTVETAANFSSQSCEDLDKIKEEIFRIYDNFDYFDLIFYTNKDARMLFAKPSNAHVKDTTYFHRDYYQYVIREKDSFIGRLIISSVLDKAHFIIAAPVISDKGETKGLIGAGIPLINIQRIIEKTQKNFGGKIWMTDHEGSLAIYPGEMLLDNLKKMVNKTVIVGENQTDFYKILNSNINTIANHFEDNTNYYSAISFVPDVNWMVVVEQSEYSVFKHIYRLSDQLKSIFIIVLLIALISGVFLAYNITNPIEKLVVNVRKMSNEIEDSELIEIGSEDEIGELELAFNDMNVKLKEKIIQLKESFIRENELQNYLNNILESTTSGIIVIDKNSRITIFNNAAEKITGYEVKDVLNKEIKYFLDQIKIDLENSLYNIINGDIINDREECITRKDNEKIFVNISGAQVVNDKNEFIGIVFIIKDISEFKKLEEELKKEDRLHILGEFSSSIIHDIGNPLAGISNLIEILKDNNLNKENKNEVIKVLGDEINDLNAIIIKYFGFIRNKSLEKNLFDIKELVEEVLNLLKSEIINKRINIEKNYRIKNGLIKVNRSEIKQVLINILINSIQAIHENGNIEIDIEEINENIFIKISDDGVGISEYNLSRIFDPFYTTKKNGSGLGLFIAYKIIKEYHGDIIVNSNESKGTEFLIKIPRS